VIHNQSSGHICCHKRKGLSLSILLFSILSILQLSFLFYTFIASQSILTNEYPSDLAVDLDLPPTIPCSSIDHSSNTNSSLLRSNTGINNNTISFESSSACLLVSDDNHLLIEWIAYHYHVINLRHLIITVDPNSQTSPQKIVNRWVDKMTIDLWNDTTIGIKPQKTGSLALHRRRQKQFNTKCLRHLKSLNKGWVLISDTDEYITINPKLRDPTSPGHKYVDWSPSLSIDQPGSLMIFLQNLILPTEKLNVNTPCIPIYRRQYSALESPPTKINSHTHPHLNLNSTNFATLRWRKYGTKPDEFQLNSTKKLCSKNRNAGPAKAIIDLSRLRPRDLLHETNKGNPHRPLESICTKNTELVSESYAVLIIHHYLGTKEQWMYREGDSRGSAYRLSRYGLMEEPKGVEESDAVRLWLKGFVEDVGVGEAERLLDGVGKLEPLPRNGESNLTVRDDPGTSGGDKYKVGEVVQVTRMGNWYWGEVRKAIGNYYDVVILNNCDEMFGTSVDKLRRNGTTIGRDPWKPLINKKADKAADDDTSDEDTDDDDAQ